jgi:hypothetical protein
LAPEPYERRVTRTLATAVATATTLADQPIRELQDSDLDVASSIGVSRELCVSLDELMLNSEVDEVQINFDWSPAFGPTDSLPPSVLILRGSRPGLRDLATRLARPEPIVSEVYSGPILEIGHSSEEDEEEGFFFVLDTTYQERPSRLRVLLTLAQHDQAIPWYRDRATVIVRGNAVQMKTMILMSAPDRIDAWSRGQFDLT